MLAVKCCQPAHELAPVSEPFEQGWQCAAQKNGKCRTASPRSLPLTANPNSGQPLHQSLVAFPFTAASSPGTSPNSYAASKTPSLFPTDASARKRKF
jgi:hypothetical protein